MFIRLKDSYVDVSKVREIYKSGEYAIGFLFDDNTRTGIHYSNTEKRDEDFENIFKKHLTNTPVCVIIVIVKER